MINFDLVDFSECISKELMFLLMLSVSKTFKEVITKSITEEVANLFPPKDLFVSSWILCEIGHAH